MITQIVLSMSAGLTHPCPRQLGVLALRARGGAAGRAAAAAVPRPVRAAPAGPQPPLPHRGRSAVGPFQIRR